MARGIDAAFGGVETTLEEQREIWAEALHPDAIWEGPTFEQPIQVIGREACGRFFELLLEVVPRFSTTVVGVHPSTEEGTVVIESTGGGDTVDGGRYTQRYFSLITTRDGQLFRMREYCNPFETYRAYGKERWEERVRQIMEAHNAPWPASQPADPASIPPRP